jgi:meso-butanediol dehydrogenase / (S,S)-butanediol dehydrogenase / diacetyl reductase
LDNDSGQVIVVTGSSGGIGGAVVRSLLGDGFTVVGIDNNIAREEFSGSDYHHLAADITNEDEVWSACAAIRNLNLTPPAHAILVAGGALPDEIHGEDPLDLDIGLFRDSVAINLTGQYICIKHIVPLLRSANGSNRSISLVSSINSMGDFGYPAYSAAKAGLAGLVKSLAVPLGHRNIRINAVAFGTVKTGYSEQVHGDDTCHFDRLRELSALERISTSDEAALVLVMLTRLSGVTGTIITADCGQTVPGNHDRSRRG